MIRIVAMAAVLLAGMATEASAYIGEGIQGRPHGGHFAERMQLRRHGLHYRRAHHRFHY